MDDSKFNLTTDSKETENVHKLFFKGKKKDNNKEIDNKCRSTTD